MRKTAMVELDAAIKVSVDGKKLFDMSKDFVWDSSVNSVVTIYTLSVCDK